MHDANIFAHRDEAANIERAIQWADMLALDADLAVPTIDHIAEHARTNKKPLFLSVGSALAGTRSWLMSNPANQADCVGGRSLVVSALLANLRVPQEEIDAFRAFVESGDTSRSFDINELCRQ